VRYVVVNFQVRPSASLLCGRFGVALVYQKVYHPCAPVSMPVMGADGRSWAGWFSFLALAILLAFLGPGPIAVSAIVDLAEIGETGEPEPTATTLLVASR